jgi:hypothetical protein
VSKLLSEDNCRLLYHTLEHTPTTESENRNIISSLKLPPTVIPIHLNYQRCVSNPCIFFNNSNTPIASEEWGLMEYGKIEFRGNPEGNYRLGRGTGLDMLGLLYNDLVSLAEIGNDSIKIVNATIAKM